MRIINLLLKQKGVSEILDNITLIISETPQNCFPSSKQLLNLLVWYVQQNAHCNVIYLLLDVLYLGKAICWRNSLYSVLSSSTSPSGSSNSWPVMPLAFPTFFWVFWTSLVLVEWSEDMGKFTEPALTTPSWIIYLTEILCIF